MKNKRNIVSLAVTAALFVLFIIFTVLAAKVDVQPVGPNGTAVGLATVNTAVAQAVGFNQVAYELTQCLGVFALIIAALFCAYGLWQLVTRRSLKRVDKDLYALAAVYAFVMAFYFFFEAVIINYRPVILVYSAEASYPSTHTLIGVCIFVTAALQLYNRVEGRILRLISFVCCIALAVATVVGRLVSGVHWFTDIVGGIILSAAIVMAYVTVTRWRKN